ncbi:hypothetical protein EN851_29910 [Mesorhizobium sp. M8A.F.Ca.ET.208.01.1.1]|uniref:hypothetical protein n=1 Tax=unclassified Mesorhizobium TaxID=325217 RepID=UPI000FD3BC7D|nr:MULTISPECIES: hypothetical protein [unclassified Mesorhizobium]RUW96878.1 hypothetical protein EOA30_29090 [Mesorhizobium sp. M8A.F.Ca.ET.059.01.1.1]TGQ87027.1 hypothetical protein EN851_29910 [Mesorhizobium sp. M8A.F.Ca.ET.208.01.1.1]TGT48184.1 hypothetical protein EN810_29810 [Mesorhizobium sp. M8A.F.Ca.ET.167.01.1.1]
MSGFLHRLVFAYLLLLPLLGGAAGAQDAASPDLGKPIDGHAGTTYADLIRMVIPDLTAKGDYYVGSSPIEMRHIAGPDNDSSPPEAPSVFSAGVLGIKAGGKERLAMLFDLGESPDSAEGYAVLALYDLTGKPRLLDAVNVATDRFTFFRHPGKLSLGASDDALMISSTHFNSNQGYMSTPLILVRDDRFELIDLINTFDENVCSYRRSQDLTFQAVSDGQPYAAIKATITDKTAPGEETCDEPAPKAVSNDISVTYRWDKKTAGYVADSDAFEKLAADNEKRF